MGEEKKERAGGYSRVKTKARLFPGNWGKKAPIKQHITTNEDI